MHDHNKLSGLIQQAAKIYLKHAGTYGKMLYDMNASFEKTMLETTLLHFDQNISVSAKALGISRTTLYKKMAFHRIVPSQNA